MDKKLVLQAKKHDKEAFVKLVENYQVSMYKTAIAILQNDEDTTFFRYHYYLFHNLLHKSVYQP